MEGNRINSLQSLNGNSHTNLLQYLRSGHTVSLDGHDIQPTKMVHSRSALLLPSRGAAWPALPVDTSALVAEETALRRKMHEEVLRENPDAFRRQFSEDSLSSSMIQQIKMKDLIKDMHLTKDLKDIDRTKTGRYTFSRLTERLLRDKQNLDEYKFETMPPVEDFVRPDDTESRRNTGYDHGHVRSLMKLDIYGPAASRQSYRDRSVGKLPTNNVDKYAILDPKNPQFMATTGQFRGSTASTSGGSRVSSAASTESSDDVFPSSPARLHTSQSHDRQQYQQQQQQTMQSTNSSTDSKRMKIMMENITGTWNNNNKQIPSPSTASSTSTFDTTYSKSIKHFGDDPLLGTSGYQDPNELTIPVSLRKNTNNMGMTRISVDDRSQLDPFIRRKEWYDSYVTRNKDAATNKKMHQDHVKDRQEQRELARLERKRIKEFERHLVLAQFEA